MRSSYSDEDVILLLKDITGMVQPQPTEEREKLIQAGKHYSEMLPVEYVPTEKYMQVYRAHLLSEDLQIRSLKKRDRTLCSSHWLAPVFQSEF